METASRRTLATLLFLLSPAILAAQPPPAVGQPLVKLHEDATLAAGPAVTRSIDQDVFVAGDGTLISVTVAADLLTGSGFASTIIRGVGSPAATGALRAALYQDRIGTLHGPCGAELFPLGSSFTYGISWFGKGSRSTQLTLTNQGGQIAACSPRQIGVLQAIETFQATVIADPATEIASSTCTSSSQCPPGLLCCYPCGLPACHNVCSRPNAGGNCPVFPF
jgi:hypothetical protein